MIVAIALVLVTFHLSDAQLNIGTAGNVLKNTEHAVENTGNTTEETANEELGRTLRPFDPASLKFSYWNHNLGNKKPTVFTIGQEENLLKDWIPEEDLKVVIHGWLATSQDINGVFAIKTAYLNVTKFNVICMDWSAISSNRFYLIPALSTKKVGTYMAEMLKNLVNLVNKGGSTLKSDNIHLIGHSLGAHIAGACGAAFTSGKIGRITGLDPAGPGFEYIIIVDHQLDKTDALFVDIIHTAAGGLGYSSSLGHVDFFPNKGSRPQPGCYDGLNLVKFAHAVGCSHTRAYELYTDSVYHMESMVATVCSSWSSYERGECKNNSETYMGHYASPSVNGNFYLRTTSSPPYGLNQSADTTTLQSTRKNV